MCAFERRLSGFDTIGPKNSALIGTPNRPHMSAAPYWCNCCPTRAKQYDMKTLAFMFLVGISLSAAAQDRDRDRDGDRGRDRGQYQTSRNYQAYSNAPD